MAKDISILYDLIGKNYRTILLLDSNDKCLFNIGGVSFKYWLGYTRGFYTN